MTDSEQVEKLSRQVRLLQGEARQLRKYIVELERERDRLRSQLGPVMAIGRMTECER